jgi:tape measure domain-containing protein
MAVIGDLVTRLGVDGRKFQSGLDKARGDARSFASDITKIVSGIAIYDIAKTGVMGLKDMLVETVKLSASAEVMRSEFAVLLGDVGKSARFFDELEKFSARTSFNLESAGDAARVLMAAGVSENSLLDTMQLLGDLSLGDANRLGFLSKAYTDVFNKGRLQGQEIKQFAENGVGIVAALAGTLGKTSGEILKMSEAGEISFDMMREALQGLTAEGGRFYGAMAARNSTLMGQWDSLMEGIQKTGRAIGDNMLPAIKNVVAEANAMLGKFNEMPDKIGFIGDVIEASFDVAIESIKAKWEVMVQEMITGLASVSGDVAMLMADPMGAGGRLAGGLVGGMERSGNLAAAQARLEGLMGKLQGPAAAGNAAPAAANDPIAQAKETYDKALQEFINRDPKAIDKAQAKVFAAEKTSGWKSKKWNEASAELHDAMAESRRVRGNLVAAEKGLAQAKKQPAIKAGAAKLTEGVSSLWESLQSPIAEAQMAAQGMWDRGKIKADAAMGTLSNIFGGDPAKKEKKIEPQLAGAMQAGSQDAYSTIVQAMIRQADPVIKATKEQTRELKRALRENRPQPVYLVGAFEE